MSDDQATPENVAQSLKILRAVVATFDERVSLLLASDHPDPDELARALLAVKKIVGATGAFGRRKRTSNKPNRGLGYSKDDALIVASLPWYKGNMSAAVSAHYPLAPHELVQVHERRIRGHRAEIEKAEGTQEWETSLKWLGDLIEE